jgi:hypothetical protein
MRAYVFDTIEEWTAALDSLEAFLLAAADGMGYKVVDGNIMPKNAATRNDALTAQPITSYSDRSISHELTNGKFYIEGLQNMLPTVSPRDGHILPQHGTYSYVEQVLGLADKVEDVSALIIQEEEE